MKKIHMNRFMLMVVAAGMLAAGAAARAADLKSEVLGNLQSEDPAIRDAAAKAVISNPSLGTNVVSDIEAIAQQFIADDQRKGTAKTAILLLGKLKSKRSIPFLIEHMTFYVPYRPGRLESIRGACPCVAALIDIGEPAFPAVLARGLKDDDMGIERCLKIIFLHAKNKTAAREFLAESLEKLKTENARNKVKDLLDFLPKDSPTPTPTVKKSEPQPVAVKESAPQSVTVNGVTYTAPLKPTP